MNRRNFIKTTFEAMGRMRSKLLICRTQRKRHLRKIAVRLTFNNNWEKTVFKFIKTSDHPEPPFIGAIMRHDDEDCRQNLSLAVVEKSIAAKERKGIPLDDLPKARDAILQLLNVQRKR